MILRSAFGSMRRVQQLVERRPDRRGTTASSCVISPSLHQVDGDRSAALRGALAGARLQHPELAALDRELDVLHVAVVLLEHAADAHELGDRPPASRASIDGLSELGGDAAPSR